MISIVTLIHNQANNLPKILKAYSNQTTQPDKFVFVLDRCTDDSEEILINFSKDNNTIIIKNENGLNFQAGYCRDLGLKYCEDSVIFLDGDCIPSQSLFEEMKKELSNDEPSIVSVKRINMDVNGELTGLDCRETTPWYIGKVFNKNKNTIIEHKELALNRMITWSCCLGLNKKAINEIKNFNENIGENNRLFPSIFDGVWGGEDDHIGDVGMLLDIRMIGLNPDNHVIHIWHKSRDNTEYEKSSNEMKKKAIEYAKKISAPGLKYLDVDINAYVMNYIESHKNNEIFLDEPLDDEQ